MPGLITYRLKPYRLRLNFLRLGPTPNLPRPGPITALDSRFMHQLALVLILAPWNDDFYYS